MKEIIKAYDYDDEYRKAMKEAERNGKTLDVKPVESVAETLPNGSESKV